MNIKKITFIMSLTAALCTCHTNIFSMKKNEFLGQIAGFTKKNAKEEFAMVYFYNPIKQYKVINFVPAQARCKFDPNIRNKLKEGLWVVITNKSIPDFPWSRFEIIGNKTPPRPNFSTGKRYKGTIHLVKEFGPVLASINLHGIDYPVICTLEKNVVRSELVPNKTSVSIKIKEIINGRILGEIIPISWEEEDPIERGEFTKEKVLPQKEVEKQKFRIGPKKQRKTFEIPKIFTQ